MSPALDIEAVLSPNLAEAASYEDAIVSPVDVDWKEYKKTVTFQDVIVSAAAVHCVHKAVNSVLTQLKGFCLGNKGYVETKAIGTDNIRAIVRKLEACESGNHKKEYICEKLVAFWVRKDKDKANGIVVPSHIVRSKKAKIWNAGRFINVLFASEFKDRFANCGQSMNKDQLDAGEKTDQKLFSDAMIAYNVKSKYGDISYSNTASIKTTPASFEPVDPDELTDGKKFFNGLMRDYEKLMRVMTRSGSHGSFKEIVLTQEKTTNPYMIYLHQHMLDNTSLFDTCVGCLHAGTAFESTPGGNLISAVNRRNQKRGGSTGGARRKKNSWHAEKLGANSGYLDALSDKAALAGEMMAMEKQKLEMEMKKTKFKVSVMKVNRAQLTVDTLAGTKERLMDKHHSLRNDIEARHGKGRASEKIEDMRQRKKEQKAEGKSTFSLSQDSIIDRYLECEDSIMEVVSKHEDAKKTLKSVSNQEKENLM